MRLPPWLWQALDSRRFRRALAILPFAIAIGLVLFYWHANTRGTAKLEQARNVLREKGFAVTYDEFIARNPEPELDVLSHPAILNFDERHFDIHALLESKGYTSNQINDLFSDTKSGRTTNLIAFGADPHHPESTRKVARDLLEILAPSSEAATGISEAFRRPRMSNALNRNGGFMDIMSAPRGANHIFSFFCSRARLRSLAGDQIGASEDIEAIFRFIQAGRQQPRTMMATIVDVAMTAVLAELVWDIAQNPAVPDSTLLKFDSWLKELDSQRALVSCFECQLLTYAEIDNLGFGSVTTLPWQSMTWDSPSYSDWKSTLSSWLWQLKPVGYIHSDAATALERIDQEFLSFPDGSRRESFSLEDAHHFGDKADSAKSVPATLQYFETSIADSVWPATSLMIKKTLKTIAAIRLTRLSLAAIRYHRTHGEFPVHTASLTPDFIESIPHDPSNGNPLTLVRNPDHSIRTIAPGWDKSSRQEWLLLPPQSSP